MSAWYDPFDWFGDSETPVPKGNAPQGGVTPVSTYEEPSFLGFLWATVKGDEMAIESWKSGYETSIPGKAVTSVTETVKDAASSIGSGLKTFLIWVIVIAIVGVFVFYFAKSRGASVGAS